MKHLSRMFAALLPALLSWSAFSPATAFAFPPGPPPDITQPPASATRPAVVGGFIAGAQNLKPGQIGLNYEYAKFDATFDLGGYEVNPPRISRTTYDLYGAVSDKLTLGFGASNGEVVDIYGKYALSKQVDLLFGKKQADSSVDVYCQYKFPFPVTIFAGTRGFDNSPVNTSDTSRRPLFGLSVFLPLSDSAGIHGMVATTNRSREWQIGLDKRLGKSFSVTLQYRGYRENGDNASTFRLAGIGLDLNYLF